MRVLCTAIASAGHVNPLLPLARSLAAAGHDVTLAAGATAATTAKRERFGFVEAGLAEPQLVARSEAQLGGVAAARRGIAMFATIAAPALLRDLLPKLDHLAPDLVIHEEGEWGGPVLAAIAGIPAVALGWGAPLWTAEELETITDATAPLWREHDVAPASPAGLFDWLYVDTCPPLLQDVRATRLPGRRTIRFEPFDSGEPLPPSLEIPSEQPVVSATLGTVPTFNNAPEVMAAIAEALGELAVDGVLTIGANNDPAELQPLPGNVRAERHLSQVQVFTRSAVAITHGGAGSTLAALAFGVPLLLLPRGAPSQRRLASACVAEYAALALDPSEATAQTIREAVRTLLENGSYGASARRIRESMREQPEAETLVPDLEALASDGRSRPQPRSQARR